MLNKQACKKCHNSHANKTPELSFCKWDNLDERFWNQKNVVICPHHYLSMISTKSPPPKGCPYYLEHLLTQQEESAC